MKLRVHVHTETQMGISFVWARRKEIHGPDDCSHHGLGRAWQRPVSEGYRIMMYNENKSETGARLSSTRTCAAPHAALCSYMRIYRCTPSFTIVHCDSSPLDHQHQHGRESGQHWGHPSEIRYLAGQHATQRQQTMEDNLSFLLTHEATRGYYMLRRIR